MQTKKAFKCVKLYDESRALGILTIGKVYPISEAIKPDYITIISDDERGFSLVPSTGGSWVNAGEAFAVFSETEVEIPEVESPTAPDVVFEEEPEDE